MKVFVLQHTHELPDGGDDVKLIGVYTTEKAANEAISALSNQPGFADRPRDFHLNAYVLDATQWLEGFTTVAIDDD